jgi:HEPN domain-containing protein
MSPELAEVREWLRKARHMAEAGLAQSPPITDAAAFHCQQAVEKYVKAYLVFRGEAFELIHDLEALMDQCVRLDPAWEALRDAVEPLTAYAVRFRYPGPADPTVAEVLAALDVAANVERFVSDRLPKTVTAKTEDDELS